MTEQLLDLLRVVNIGLSFFTAGALAVRVNDDWPHLTHGWRITIAGLVSLLLVITYGSTEALYQGAPVGFRIALITAVCAVVLSGLWVARHDADSPGVTLIPAPRIIAVIQEADAPDYGDPCQHPGCLAAREKLLRLTRAAAADKARRDLSA